MELYTSAIDRSRPRHLSLSLHPVKRDDVETIARLQSISFGSPLEEAREHVARGLLQPNRRYYLGMLEAEPIGLLRVGEYGESVDITAFGVLPEHRGRGYGRQMLMDTVDMLLREGWGRIVIEVATENRNALGLYESCGFKATHTYGYYQFAAITA